MEALLSQFDDSLKKKSGKRLLVSFTYDKEQLTSVCGFVFFSFALWFVFFFFHNIATLFQEMDIDVHCEILISYSHGIKLYSTQQPKFRSPIISGFLLK